VRSKIVSLLNLGLLHKSQTASTFRGRLANIKMSKKNQSWMSVFALVAVTLITLSLFVIVPKGKAIPAFSRKYQTSCTTCHNNYPELNDFGEAFKKNGFKFPKDDEVFVKQDPVMLGSKAQKEAFPEAVYPGEIPGTVPISFRYSGYFNWNANQPAALQSSGFVPRTDLFAPNTVTLIAAGSFGPNLSFWIDDDLSTGGSGALGGLGDGWLKYNDLGRFFHLPKNALNVRMGQFELDLPFTQARTTNLSDYDVFDQANVAGQFGTTNNPFFLGAPQRAIEFGGYPNDGNFSWSVTLGNGSNDGPAVRNTKDVYIRTSYKFNLERDAESRKAIQAAGPTGPRDHTSIRVGGFYYYGKNQQNFGNSEFPSNTFGTIEEPFYRVGGDLRFKYRKLELYALGMVGHDDNHLVDTEGQTISKAHAITYTGGFVGGNYWLYPWLIVTAKYDFVNSPTDYYNGVSEFRTRNRFSPGVQVLVRANIKIAAEYQYHWRQPYADPNSESTLFFRPNTFVTGIDYVF
jgi:hypothetical protein